MSKRYQATIPPLAVTEQQKADMKELAKVSGMSVSEIQRRALAEYVSAQLKKYESETDAAD